MTAQVASSARAEADLEGTADYVAQDDPKRAASFVRELSFRCERMAEQPRANRLREDFGLGVRVLVHGSHLIPHAERRDVLVIERVMHGARDAGRLPDDWGPNGPRSNGQERPSLNRPPRVLHRPTPSPAPLPAPNSRP